MVNTTVGTDILKAASLLREGGLVAIPTETVYGLAANAYDLEAVAKIYAAKNRPFFDPLILHVASLERALDLFETVPPLLSLLAHSFWPGPLTLVAPKKKNVPDLITAGSPLVAVRVPSHPLTLQLLQQLDFPLAAPSANPFGYVSPTTAQHVLDQLGGKIDYVLEGGACEKGIESTIIGFTDLEPELWRLGSLTTKQIETVLQQTLRFKLHNNANPSAPGQLDKHYAPHTKLRLLSHDEILTRYQALSDSEKQSIAFLSFGQNRHNALFPHAFSLSDSGSLPEAAQLLYATIRQIDPLGFAEMWIELFENNGLGAALNDRLKRAAWQG